MKEGSQTTKIIKVKKKKADRITQLQTYTILQGKGRMTERAELWAQMEPIATEDYSQVLRPNGVYY